MAFKNIARAPVTPSYVDFDPISEIKEEDGADTLIIALPGFKKEQMRVQVSNTGVLKVSGEKQENADPTKKRRFIKETTVPEHCDINAIRAKFANGELRVLMPKKVMTPPRPVIEEKPAAIVSAPLPTAETVRPTDQKMDLPGDVSAKMGRAKEQMVGLGGDLGRKLQGRKNNVDLPNDVDAKMGRAKEQVVGLGGDLVKKLQRRKNNNVAIGLGVAMVAMVAIGVFVAYKYGSSTSSYMED